MRHGLVTLSFLSHRCDTNVTGMTVDSLKSSSVIGRKRAELVVYSRFGRRRSHCATRAGVQVPLWHKGCNHLERVRMLISNTHKRPQLARSLIE
jgi:hypothetical protein